MSYIKNRIAKDLKSDPAFRAAYDEEVELLEQAKARRQEVMKRVTAVRKAHNLTQEQLAKKLKISQERVSQIERGTETISIDKLLDIVAALGLHVAIVEDADIQRHGLQKMVVS